MRCSEPTPTVCRRDIIFEMTAQCARTGGWDTDYWVFRSMMEGMAMELKLWAQLNGISMENCESSVALETEEHLYRYTHTIIKLDINQD